MRESFAKARSGLWSPGFFLFSFILIFHDPASGQSGATVRSLSFERVSALSVNELRAEFSSKEGRPFSRDLLNDDVQKLLARYHREGYLFSSAEPVITFNEDSSSASITIAVTEGNPVIVGSVQIMGNIPPQEMNNLRHGLIAGELFHPELAEQGIHRLLLFLDSRGYPFAKGSVDRIEFRKGDAADSAFIMFSIDAGEMIIVKRVIVEGNSATKTSVIEREARFAENAPFSEKVATTVKRRLDRLRLFSTVSMPEFVVQEEGVGGILIRVKEGNPNRFDGVLGYVPASGNQTGYVTGLVDLEFRNLFGTARAFSVKWLRENSSTQDLALRYREPWVASLPIDAELGFDQRKQDSTYLRRGYEVGASYAVSDVVSVGFTFRQSSVFPAERTVNPVAGSDTWWLGGRIIYNGRDNDVNPTEGVYYQSSYEAGEKSGPSLPDAGTGRATLDLEYYLPVASRQVLAAAGHARDIRSSVLEQSDLLHMGGTSTIRGYRESQFLCSRAIWMNIEYRFLPGQRSQLFGFVDVAYLALQDRPAASLAGFEQTKIGYGVGARVDSPVGIIGFSIGVGEGDTFRTAKLHVRLINEF